MVRRTVSFTVVPVFGERSGFIFRSGWELPSLTRSGEGADSSKAALSGLRVRTLPKVSDIKFERSDLESSSTRPSWVHPQRLDAGRLWQSPKAESTATDRAWATFEKAAGVRQGCRVEAPDGRARQPSEEVLEGAANAQVEATLGGQIPGESAET